MPKRLPSVFVLSSFCLCPAITLAGSLACPSHTYIKEHARLEYIDYGEHYAYMYFTVPYHSRTLTLSFRLPAQPPFARPISSHYVSDSEAYNRGNVNWGLTHHYQTDFASTLMRYIAYRDVYPLTSQADCLYLSTLEGYFLYGHIWMLK